MWVTIFCVLTIFSFPCRKEINEETFEEIKTCKNKKDVFNLIGPPHFFPGQRIRNFDQLGSLTLSIMDQEMYTWLGASLEIYVGFDNSGKVVSIGRSSRNLSQKPGDKFSFLNKKKGKKKTWGLAGRSKREEEKRDQDRFFRKTLPNLFRPGMKNQGPLLLGFSK